MEHVPAKAIVSRRQDAGWFGCAYNMNIYRSCSHGCVCCDSRSGCYRIQDFECVRAAGLAAASAFLKAAETIISG